MQRTADFHHHVAHPGFPHPNGLFEHAAALHTTIDMFDAHSAPRDLPVVRFLRGRQLVPAGLLGLKLEKLSWSASTMDFAVKASFKRS